MRVWKRSEKGAAVVETALVLPIFLTILFGIFEVCWVMVIRNTMQFAVRDGGRAAAVSGEDTALAEATLAIQNRMDTLGLSNYTLGMTEIGADNAYYRLELTLPYSSVSFVGTNFGFDFTLRSIAVVRKEHM